VAEGQYKGMGLDQADWLGAGMDLGAVTGSNFPILLKILSVGQWLSVQVHPDDKQAREMETTPGAKARPGMC
jgi:mannose-6-phosphate isomerase